MQALLSRFFRCEAGTANIEYGIIGTTLSIVLIVSLVIIGPKVSGYFTSAGNGMH